MLTKQIVDLIRERYPDQYTILRTSNIDKDCILFYIVGKRFSLLFDNLWHIIVYKCMREDFGVNELQKVYDSIYDFSYQYRKTIKYMERYFNNTSKDSNRVVYNEEEIEQIYMTKFDMYYVNPEVK